MKILLLCEDCGEKLVAESTLRFRCPECNGYIILDVFAAKIHDVNAVNGKEVK